MKKTIRLYLVSMLSLFCWACLPQAVMVEGTAMQPAFNEGDRLLMDRNIGELKRGEVISFQYPKDKTKQYLKRIIGLPDEKIEMREGKVFINGTEIDEPYVDQTNNQNKASFPAISIPENEYYVLGDNRDSSSDSRYWGTVSRDLIVGKYYTTYSKAEK